MEIWSFKRILSFKQLWFVVIRKVAFRATVFERLFFKQFSVSNMWLNLNWNIGMICNRFSYIASCYLETCVIPIVSFAVIWDISLKRGWTFGQTFSLLFINRQRGINDVTTKIVLNNFLIPLLNELFWSIPECSAICWYETEILLMNIGPITVFIHSQQVICCRV